jgi:carbamoyl-phosphate synthase large subunit
MGVPCITTMQAFGAAVQGIEAVLAGPFGVRSLQEYGRELEAARAGEAQ